MKSLHEYLLLASCNAEGAADSNTTVGAVRDDIPALLITRDNLQSAQCVILIGGQLVR